MADLGVRNDNDVYVKNLRLARTGAYVNDAVLAFTVYDENDVALTGATGISMSYVAASNGHYRGTIPYSVGLTPTTTYKIVITSTNYPGFRRTLSRAAVIQS